MTNPAGAGAEALGPYVELEDLDIGAYLAERERRYQRRLADEADAACVAIEAQIEGLRQSLASRRGEAEEYRAAVAGMGA